MNTVTLDTTEQRFKEDPEEALIPNKQLEEMFLRICDDDQMQEYIKLAKEKGMAHTATAYASHRVKKVFNFLVEHYERSGGDFELLQDILYPKSK
jgi:hypothetical protein